MKDEYKDLKVIIGVALLDTKYNAGRKPSVGTLIQQLCPLCDLWYFAVPIPRG